jgi:predicted dehydrogenase
VKSADPRFAEVEEGMAVTLRFPGDRLGAFICSYNAAPESRYVLAGTEGSLTLLNAYEYLGERRLSWTTKGGAREKAFPEVDQFGPELDYFAECVRTGREPEPSGEEGLADVRIINAIHQSASTRAPVHIEPIPPRARPGLSQLMRRPAVGKRAEVHMHAPTQG